MKMCWEFEIYFYVGTVEMISFIRASLESNLRRDVLSIHNHHLNESTSFQIPTKELNMQICLNSNCSDSFNGFIEFYQIRWAVEACFHCIVFLQLCNWNLNESKNVHNDDCENNKNSRIRVRKRSFNSKV